MSKARITYRFDDPGREPFRKEPRPVIPLFKEEFTIIREEREPAGDMPEPGFSREGEPVLRTRREFVDTGPLNQFTTDFGAWKSPFDAETEKVERMIRESSEPRGPDRVHDLHPEPMHNLHPDHMRDRQPDRKHDREPDRKHDREPKPERLPVRQEAMQEDYIRYDGPEAHDRRDGPYMDEYVSPAVARGHYERHHFRTPWLKMIASVSGAIATGVLIGFFVLSMFGGDDVPNGAAGGAEGAGNGAATVPAQTKTPGTDASGTSGTSGAAAPASSSSAAVSVNIAAQSYTLLQNGVFSNQQGADAAAAELKKKGLAAYVQPADMFYVYAGMAPSHDDALALSGLLKEQNMELFLKSLALPAATKIRWSGEQGTAPEQFFAQSRKLVETIGSFAAARLKEKTPSPIDDGTLQTVHAAHQTWTGASGPFGAGLAEEQKPALQKWTTAINTAVASIDEYKKNPSSAYLWGAQSSLMQALFAEQELLTAIKAQ